VCSWTLAKENFPTSTFLTISSLFIIANSMITKEIKDIIRPLIECVASLTTKQAAILELIA
jgi:hypothetical protein